MKYKYESTKIFTALGEFDFYCFSWGIHEENNILCLVNSNYRNVPYVRVQSACYTSEIFGSLDCDCHEQLHKSQKLIAEEGGYLIYMLCDGRGAGLMAKVKGLELGRIFGLDTSDAYKELGIEQDPRDYSKVSQILDFFGLKEINLLTNNPRKIDGLTNKCKINRVSLEIKATENSKSYLKTKAKKMGHMLSQFNE